MMIVVLIELIYTATDATTMIAFYDKTKRTLLMYVEKYTQDLQVISKRSLMISATGCVANTQRDY